MAIKGYCSKTQSYMGTGDYSASISFPKELKQEVNKIDHEEVYVLLASEYDILTKAEVDKANEDTIDGLLRGTDILERLLKVSEEERDALFELLKIYNHAAVDEDRKAQMPYETEEEFMSMDIDEADRRGDELMEAQDILLERKMLLGEGEE